MLARLTDAYTMRVNRFFDCACSGLSAGTSFAPSRDGLHNLYHRARFLVILMKKKKPSSRRGETKFTEW